MVDDFLQIYKFPFHRLTFDKVRLIQSKTEFNGRRYFVFEGIFSFKPPENVLNMAWISKKQEILKGIKYGGDDFSKIFRRKFTRKVTSGKENVKTVFNYIFDMCPMNIMDFNIIDDKLILNIKGYGLF